MLVLNRFVTPIYLVAFFGMPNAVATQTVIDMLANVITSEDKDAITYAFIAYKYTVKSKPFMFFGSVKKISKLIKDVFNGLS